MYKEVLEFGAPLEEIVGEDEKREYRHGKPVVMYSEVLYLEVGRPAILVPVDHPTGRLNGRTVTTSRVQGANADTGEIETLNTFYVPHPSCKKPYFELT